MPEPVDIGDAEAGLVQLLARVERGEEIVIARAGNPIARLCPIAARPQLRQLGMYAGQIEIADDFDILPADLVAELGVDG